ncbi:hypothetical protein, partial [Streptosporangium sp. NPDC048865]|uniref:hypothetical protein n=1 Tax=Streptosporangium sp. NPDC048865 TaxID=3155766 RepID=UPI003443B08B
MDGDVRPGLRDSGRYGSVASRPVKSVYAVVPSPARPWPAAADPRGVLEAALMAAARPPGAVCAVPRPAPA